MVRPDVLTEKMLRLKQYLDELKQIKPESYKVYMQNVTLRYAVERLMQLIVDLALDINNMFLSMNRKPPAPDYFNSFVNLAECGVLDETFAIAIAPSTGLRNRLVREYESINNEIVFASLDKMINQYTQYLIAVNQYLNS